ncbi:hypothetical protein TRVA0_037S01398 [Trichomonascus vanleenenianus]|uniref:ATP-binding protein n=1 Tax=Trichomonascus vanleenenianus TaxID=2268995 RepID=UPI003ECADA81
MISRTIRTRALRPGGSLVVRRISTTKPARVDLPGGFPNPLPMDSMGPEEDDKSKNKKTREEPRGKFYDIFMKSLETGAIMVASLSCLGLAGVLYHNGYHRHALNKMAGAFNEGDPAFELTMHSRSGKSDNEGWVVRKHQDLIDDIIAGNIVGRYYLLIGEKGTGKTSMILEAMKKVSGVNCTFLDAHRDPEIFRIRLGKALNFEFHEDYLGALFSIRGPRDTTALLDIERAFNRLEQVALEHRKKHKKPFILVINNAHLIRDDEEGQSLVELLQQRAESLSGAGLVTMIFNSDDYWLYERLKQLGTRLDVISINDLDRKESVLALKRARRRFNGTVVSDAEANDIYNLIGGRPQHLASVASKPDMLEACHHLIDKEKTWFLNQCGLLGEGMDDDVMESGKFSTSAMFLVREMVKIDRTQRLENKSAHDLATENHDLPKIPLWRARQIMTRPDYIQVYDNLNIFTIDSHSMVKADSVPMMQAFHEIASEPGFDELVDETADRVSAIESLGRTRELVAKDLVLNGRYKIGVETDPKSKSREMVVRLEQVEEEEKPESEADDGFNYLAKQRQRWWTMRQDKYTNGK